MKNSVDVSFAQADVATGGGVFRTYTWTAKDVPDGAKRPLIVLHHGAGSSGLTFSLAAEQLALALRDEGAVVVAFDARGHGASQTETDDLALPLLAEDLVALVNSVRRDDTQEVCLVGHSMGASVVVDACLTNNIKNIVGVAVVDVVEGTAIDSLTHMHSILKSRPSQFKSEADAIKWSLRNHQLQNKESATISIPPLLLKKSDDPPVFTWRTDLLASEPHWKSWFEGLSSKFLSIKCGRLLILAGTDRLDKELMIGQMQGKFQMVVFPESLHYVQEDVPGQFAGALAEFWRRNQKLVIIKRFPIPVKPNVVVAPHATAPTAPGHS
ncbi:Protein phosphatase methylesterase 1 [Podochytrium sp. JEL0797]|nr:Protein phosphatase methylesterase 1 [Podochytrium sp. JEL0797]